LHAELVDFLPELVEVLLLLVSQLAGLVVLFLDLSQLEGDLLDLLLLILVGGRVVGWFQKSSGLHIL